MLNSSDSKLIYFKLYAFPPFSASVLNRRIPNIYHPLHSNESRAEESPLGHVCVPSDREDLTASCGRFTADNIGQTDCPRYGGQLKTPFITSEILISAPLHDSPANSLNAIFHTCYRRLRYFSIPVCSRRSTKTVANTKPI